ncbi:hypothetical protein AGRA3207_004220 [Actinomadura graeca]|uniref:Uncharacterized protein n=1 Tax=Actinomadura graeca TaxID=2750812 RepID=A0ABX8QY56_9ACTN|nr:hypothetical protein [Actinomadura graeca]QXJ23104.1 hypothetical protein AGRA3207_004220 [Actinomadura graeca]
MFLVLCGAMLVASTFLGALPLVLAAMAGAIALGAEGAARRRSRGAHRRVRGTHRRPRAAPAAGTPAAAPPAGEAATGADEVIVQDGAVVRDAAPVEAGKSGTAR